METEPTDKDLDEAFIKGWNAKDFGDNPYKQYSVLARLFVDGLADRIKLKRLGLI